MASLLHIADRLTPRERRLLCLLLGGLFLFANVLLWEKWIARRAQIRAAIAAQQTELRALTGILSESALWTQRSQWLDEHQPKLANPREAGVHLLDQIKTTAQAHEVLLESPLLNTPESRDNNQVASVQITAKCSWPSLIRFLHAMQSPENFIVFENASLQTDPATPSRMLCKLTIAKWYAP